MPNGPTAQERECSSVLRVVSYDLVVELTGGAARFSSRTEIRFCCKRPGSTSFADLQAARVRRAVLNGANLEIGRTRHASRLELPRLASENTLVVDAEFSYTSAAAGLHRVTGPEGDTCVYSKAYPGGAPRIFCCFDQADLRAPFTIAVKAPDGWSCLANGPVISRADDGDAGWWRFATTRPIAPLVASICAGPFSGPAFTCQRHPRLPLPVTVNALPSAAAHLESTVSSELVRQPLAYYEHGLGTAYLYGKCDFVFVPAFPKRAFGAPGLVTIRDTELAARQADGTGLQLALVIAHELAHEWFGGIIDLCRHDDSWLIEALTTYISRTALEEIHPGATPWAPAVSQAMPDHAYAPNAAKIRQLDDLIGRQAVLTGLRELLRRHAHGCATKDDLVHYWSQASGINLRSWATEMLRPAAADKGGDAP
jgi:aminopeptidase N